MLHHSAPLVEGMLRKLEAIWKAYTAAVDGAIVCKVVKEARNDTMLSSPFVYDVFMALEKTAFKHAPKEVLSPVMKPGNTLLSQHTHAFPILASCI